EVRVERAGRTVASGCRRLAHRSADGDMVHKIRYVCTNREVICDEHGRTVLDISIANGIPHWRECGGHGRCTTCRVRILDGMENVSPRTPREQAMAAARGWEEGIRLGCQVCVRGDVTLER